MAKIMKEWEIYQDVNKKWRWRRFGLNGTQIGASSQGYASKSYCEQNAVKHGIKR